ncbi:MAG: DUF262 domain-containing protein [Polyangiaceae bacterium]|nr:DUF262 domain-containing protein [Polyangiaceae bacterium]
MGTTSKPLKELLQLVDDGNLLLPEIQRDFVWLPRNVILLFDSLYRGLPIGHMLVWKTKMDVTTGKFKHGPKGNSRNFYGYLLDGQQRLTAISLVRSGDDNYPLLFALWPDDEQKPDTNRFSWRTKNLAGDPWYIAVDEVLHEGFSPLPILQRLRDDAEGYVEKQHGDRVLAALTRLQNILSYQIGLTEYGSDNYRDATELFIRFNSTGTRLKKADLAMAELALRVPQIVSDGMSAVTANYDNFQFTRHFLVSALAAVHTGRLNMRRGSDVWDDGDDSAIQQSWSNTAKAVGKVVELVTGTVHWDSHLWMPSVNALIPLIYVLVHGTSLSAEQRHLARKWLLLICVRRFFSGSGHGELDNVLRRLQREPSIEKLYAVTKARLRRLQPVDFDVSHRSGPAMSLFVSMLRDRGAKDWKKQTPLNGTVLGHNAELQVHHFFPRALLIKAGYDSSSINTFANYAIISKATNLDISDEEPASYVPRLTIRAKDLAAQCIPDDESLWSVGNYDRFLATRRKLLASTANEFLG